MSTINIELDKRDMKELRDFAQDFEKDLRAALKHVAEKARDYALQNTPTDEGDLKGGYWTDVDGTGSDLDAWIGNTDPRAHLAEWGWKKHFVPFKIAPRLKAWAERKGLPDLFGLETEKPKISKESGYVISPAVDKAGDFFPSRLTDKVEERWAR